MDETGATGANDATDDLKGPHEVYEGDETSETNEPADIEPSGDPDLDMRMELVIATFADEAAAKLAYDEIREAEKQGILLLVDAAVVNRDHANKLHIKEETDMKGGEGAVFGAAIGAILGMIAGPLGLVIGGAAGAAVGAAVGAVAAESSDAGMSDDRLSEFAESLTPGSSMVIVAVAHYWSALASAFLTRAGGEASTIVLTDDLARQLDINGPGDQ
jgi:uncharacterized membrane protein